MKNEKNAQWWKTHKVVAEQAKIALARSGFPSNRDFAKAEFGYLIIVIGFVGLGVLGLIVAVKMIVGS